MFVSHTRGPYRRRNDPPDEPIIKVKTPNCYGRKCMAIRACKEKCRLIEARASERLGSSVTSVTTIME